FVSSVQILPSPTTGTFPAQAFNWRNPNSIQSHIKQEADDKNDKISSDFSFHQSMQSTQQQDWSYQEATRKEDDSFQPFSPEIATIQAVAVPPPRQYQTVREQRRAEDGYNWR
ncbi:hypothetical protein LINPERHAP2_LOCUS5052, partial [Linum perenne]